MSDIDTKTFLKYCDDFVATTNTDVALAHYYLQNNDFNLERAIENYNSQEHVLIRGFTVPKVERYGLSSLKVLSWNIEGLQIKDRVKRTETAINVMKSCGAHIILLQELVEEVENQMRDALKNDFDFFVEDYCKADYYCGIVVKKDRNIEVIEKSFEIRSFSVSTCGRQLLILKLTVNNLNIKVMTSHLESTKAFSAERKTQLLEAFTEMTKSDLSIFGGDLNLRDKEVLEIGGVPEDIVDLWQCTGARPEIEATWDPKRNFNANQYCPGAFGLRFDRMYLYRRPNTEDDESHRLVPRYFELEGLETVPQGIRFPSDHWALLAHFELN